MRPRYATLPPRPSAPCALPRPRAGGRLWPGGAKSEPDPDEAATVAAHFLPDQPNGPPIPAVDGVMAESSFWADMAGRAEMDAYALACVTRMAPTRRAAFLAYMQRGVVYRLMALSRRWRRRMRDIWRGSGVLVTLCRACRRGPRSWPMRSCRLTPSSRRCRGATWSRHCSTGGHVGSLPANPMSARRSWPLIWRCTLPPVRPGMGRA